LDFTAEGSFPDDGAQIRTTLDGAMIFATNRFGVKARTQRVRRNPPGADKTYATYQISIGYQLPEDRHFADFETWDRPLVTVVVLEISLNDVVCNTQQVALGDDASIKIRVCTLEDILAEKLRALLQQVVRKRTRKQDLFDIARMIGIHGDEIDRDKVAAYFERKCRGRDIEPRRELFNEDVRRQARIEYDSLFADMDPDYFIAFEEAWLALQQFLSELPLHH